MKPLSHVGTGLANWLKPLVLATKFHCGVFLQKNGNSDELKNQRFIAFSVVGWV